MTILIDCDDTIWNTCEAWVKWLNSHQGTDVNINDITEWDMKKAFPTLTDDEIYRCLKDEIFWLTVTPKKDAIKYIPLIQDLGHEIYFVTATNPDSIKYKAKMLNEWFPSISKDRLITCYNKQMIRGDVIIDDAIHNFDPKKICLLFSANHNRNIKVSDLLVKYPYIKRFDNWKNIYEFLK